MSHYHLPSGRVVQLSRFAMVATYAGMMEGTLETASPIILQGAAERASVVLSPAEPLVVIKPDELPLPERMCVVELQSHRGARETDPDYSSRLYVCWFETGTDRSIDAMLKDVLPRLDWERDAEDFNIVG